MLLIRLIHYVTAKWRIAALQLLLILSCLLFSIKNGYADDVFAFDNPQTEAHFQELLHTLRCPQCEGTSLAESNAPISQDLKKLIYQRLKQGESPKAIQQYLIARYGEAISFAPRSVWLNHLPLLLLGAITMILFKIYKTKR